MKSSPSGNCADAASLTIPDHLHPALGLLLEGYDYAHELGRDVWDFALAVQCLHRHGQTDNGLRWLIVKGLVTHASENSTSSTEPRVFSPEAPLQLTERSCFVLTPQGADCARKLTPMPSPLQSHANGHTTVTLGNGQPASTVPHWDECRRELRIGDLVIKQFKRPAGNQELILAAFEEEGWPPRIDDPLPPSNGIDPKQRLHDTIQRLNQHQLQSRIRFRGDGMGRGVRWEFVTSQIANGANTP